MGDDGEPADEVGVLDRGPEAARSAEGVAEQVDLSKLEITCQCGNVVRTPS
ncbi:MAG: hypothetical protein QOJ11_3204 [Frankiales bacterium]|jgi:hypothetical protein|nr:hypothetical protein [Frankiales bacterium]